MTATPRAKRRAGKTRRGPAGRRVRTISARKDVTVQRADVRDFIIAISIELTELAFKNGLDALSVIFDMAREVAEADRSASDKHLRRS